MKFLRCVILFFLCYVIAVRIIFTTAAAAGVFTTTTGALFFVFSAIIFVIGVFVHVVNVEFVAFHVKCSFPGQKSEFDEDVGVHVHAVDIGYDLFFAVDDGKLANYPVNGRPFTAVAVGVCSVVNFNPGGECGWFAAYDSVS